VAEAAPDDAPWLLYQPLADLQTGEVSGLEAIVCRPRGADAAGNGADGATASLRRACGDLRAWRDGGLTGLSVSIDIDAAQFTDAGFAAAVAATLDDYGIAAAALTLEIGEAALSAAGADCDAILAGLKARGLTLTLDGFGAGPASLSNLRRDHFDAVKIARAVIGGVGDSGGAALCKAIIAMAHELGMKVMAEGVDSESQCDFLRRNMCDQVQGDLIAPPLAPATLHRLLAGGSALAPHLLRMHKPQRRLLLVDDEPNIVAALKRLLRADQYQVYTANNGQQALDVLAEHEVDVIVSDQRMPGMLGADFLRKAKQIFPDTIRIMLSGYTELQSVTDAVNEGAIYKFLTKPWDDEQLRGHIADAFRIKEIADDNQRLNLAVRGANQELAAANRRMEQLLQEKQRQISRDEISLHIARELLQHLPLPVIGMDDAGMIAFINGAAEGLFRHSGALLGNEAGMVLPELFPQSAAVDAGAVTAGQRQPGRQSSHVAVIDGQRYAVVVYPMGEHSASRGSLITLSLAGDER
jgi:EAL domain-containing protein (putative c-di-GMP-specific phosphodiesterase class I)/CheY-like chemotaxis protein